MTVTVDGLLFGGVIPGVLQFVFTHKMESVGTLLPPQVNEDSGFAAMMGKNDSADNEYYEIYSGANGNMDKYYQINRWGPTQDDLWHNLTNAYWWDKDGGYNGSNACNELRGKNLKDYLI